jgi:hypothetical protein
MRVRAAIVLFVLMLLPPVAHAEARFALLICNQAYDPSVGILKNPRNDIALVGDALAKRGFEVLPPIKDATRIAILGGVRDLVRRLNTAGSGAIGFIYYSGHGAAEKDTNINYLIPVDAKEPGSTAFWDASLKLDDILRLLDGARSAAKFIVFDACRNELQLPTKDTTKGLVPVAEQQGMFIAYASAPGRTASDRGDSSGPYAAALAAEFARPGLDHLNLFQNVKETVLAATGGAQQPWESNGLGRRVYLTGQPKTVDVPGSQSGTQDQLSDAAREWPRVDKTSIAELEIFLSRHGSSAEADYARARLAPLKKQQADLAQQAADAAKKKADDEALAKGEAERQRLAMLQQELERKRSGADAPFTLPSTKASFSPKDRLSVGDIVRLRISSSINATERFMIQLCGEPCKTATIQWQWDSNRGNFDGTYRIEKAGKYYFWVKNQAINKASIPVRHEFLGQEIVLYYESGLSIRASIAKP